MFIQAQAMSEEQITAFFAAVKADAGLEEKLKCANDIDGAVTIANEAGFSVSKDAWLKYHADQTLELSDDEVAGVTGGNHPIGWASSGGKNGGFQY